MKVTREQTEILLMEYAAGVLDEARALLAASYVTICPEARRYTRECESFGGALMEDCNPVSMHGASLKTVLGRLDECGQDNPCADKSPGLCGQQQVPRPIAAHLKTCGKPARWHMIAPGLRYCPLPVQNANHAAMLVRLSPGVKAPRHRHDSEEMTLVLEGGYEDEFGRYQRGDLVIVEAGTIHAPVADRTQGCTCIIVHEKPPRFTGGIYAVFNFFIR